MYIYVYVCTHIGFSNDDPNDPWACVRSGSNGGVIVRGSSDESLIDIPSRTAQDDFVRAPNRDKDARPTTTDRPSFLPPKETVIGILDKWKINLLKKSPNNIRKLF